MLLNTFSEKHRWAGRKYLALLAGFLVVVAGPLYAEDEATATMDATQAAAQPAETSAPVIVVNKTSTCSCCAKWVDVLKAYGFEVEVNTVANTRGVQAELGVPKQLGSCHTAKVGDYFVEGHVPPEIIQQLIDEKRDDIVGIGVPGMPAGSPGMESPRAVQYDVVAYGKNGQFYKYATISPNS
jgi:hypothetical protein